MKIVIALALVAAASAFQSVSVEDPTFKFYGYTTEQWAAEYLMPVDPLESHSNIDFTNAEALVSSTGIDLTEEEWSKQCVHAIRDQGSCGSCWAFATSEMTTDRYCLETGQTTAEDWVYSPQDLVDCDTQESGCMGAATQRVVTWIAQNGITLDTCHPYQAVQRRSVCPADNDYACDANAADNTRYAKGATDHVFTGSAGPSPHIKELTEALESGPIYLSMQCPGDFMTYSSGIFESKTGGSQGGHAVKCVGWGTDEDRVNDPQYSFEDSHYWKCANSWGARWGEQGYFRIYMNQKIGYNAGWLDNFPEAVKVATE